MRLAFGLVGQLGRAVLHALPEEQTQQLGVGGVVVQQAVDPALDVVRVDGDGDREVEHLLLEHGREQLALVAVVGVDELLVGLGLGRDAVDARAGDAVAGELRHRRLEDPGLGGLGVPCCHGARVAGPGR